MVEVKVTGGQISEEEKNAYIERGIKNMEKLILKVLILN